MIIVDKTAIGPGLGLGLLFDTFNVQSPEKSTGVWESDCLQVRKRVLVNSIKTLKAEDFLKTTMFLIILIYLMVNIVYQAYRY
jgi:hypothetical protein